MNDDKPTRHVSSVSRASSYEEMGAYWDEHDSADLGSSEEVAFDVEIDQHHLYVPIHLDLERALRRRAEERGTTAEVLVQEWLEEKLAS